MWFQKLYRVASFGMRILQSLWTNSYFRYPFTNKSLEDSDAKISYPMKILRPNLDTLLVSYQKSPQMNKDGR